MKKILLILLLVTYSAMSQSLSVFDVDASNFPTIKAKFYAFDKDGNQILNLSPSDFEVKENGQPREVTNVSCPAPKPPQALSSVLTIDVSGSMSGQSLENAKAAGRAWVEGLPLGKSECAISSFDDKNYLNQDFTTNKNKLLTAINNLQAMGGTDYDYALINPLAGGLLVTKNGKYKRVLVLLSDGQPNREPQTSQIISEATKQNVTVYAVTLNMACPKSLKDISTQTAGMWFENVTTEEQARQIYQLILQNAQGGDPCEIEWQSEVTCSASEGITNVEIRLIPQNISASASYPTPSSSVAYLEFNPNTVKFIDPGVGVIAEQKVTVTARNANFTVTNISCNNAAFDIHPKSFVLNTDQSIELTVSYLPADNGYVYGKFEIENDVCPKKIYASGGWKGIRPKIRTLKLIHPNGGEVFVAGSDTVITWEGVLPDEPVKIEYSIDNGANWITIADSALNLNFKWHVPKTPSNQCLARVTAAARTSLYCDNPDVEICGKVWMGCNLEVVTYRNGDPIKYCQTDGEWLDAANKQEGAWCYYDNDISNGELYGKLYNWYAVNDPRGLAPEGWHIPTDEEWTELENCLGGSSVAGGKMKTIGTIEAGDGLWYSPNTGATNESGFSALPGGYRYHTGTFAYIGLHALWWSASNFTVSHAWYKFIHNKSMNIFRSYFNKEDGFSVRCVRDE